MQGLLGVIAEPLDHAGERVVLRAHGPDDLARVLHEFLRGGAHAGERGAQAGFVVARAFRFAGEENDPTQTRAYLVMQIAGESQAFALHGRLGLEEGDATLQRAIPQPPRDPRHAAETREAGESDE